MSAPRWTADDLPDLSGTTAIVTGANSGIGKVAATELARHGAEVTLAVRNLDKGKAAADHMPGKVIVRHLDLSSLDSVRTFVDGTDGTVDLLIDNAGIMGTPLGKTADGFELQFGTNHLGHFALTLLLLPQVTKRVVVISSDLHRRGQIDLADLNWERRPYKPWGAYSQSKLANLMFALELQKRLVASGSAIESLAAHPGYAATGLQSGTEGALMKIAGAIGNALVAQSEEMGALPTLYAATQDLPGGSFIGPRGFMNMRGYPGLDSPAPQALDAAVAAKLWDQSLALTGVSWPL